MLTDEELRQVALASARLSGVSNPSTSALVRFARLIIVAYEKKLREEKPVYQVWRSTDNCNEFYSWDDCDKSDYDLASEQDRRILFEHPSPSAPEVRYNPDYPWRPMYFGDKCPACFENFDFDHKCENCGSGYEAARGGE